MMTQDQEACIVCATSEVYSLHAGSIAKHLSLLQGVLAKLLACKLVVLSQHTS